MINDRPNIAFIGTGLMGAPMARCLLKAGFDVRVWNRSAEKAEALRNDGATIMASPAEAAQSADVVITMLTAGAAVTEVLFDMGTMRSAKPGATFVDMSSIAPSTARDIAARLEEGGYAALDAPVSGGTKGANEATLAIMVGGERDTFKAIEPVFEAMGRATLGRATYVGPPGSGQLAKLANQAIVAITIGAVSEALLLVEAGGAFPGAVRNAIRGGFAESCILELHGKRMLDRDWRPGGASVNQLKDLDNVLDAAKEAGITLPLTQNVRDRYHQMVHELGLEGHDHSALLLQLESINSPHRLGDRPDQI